MKICINNENDTLKSCLLCYPTNYRITSKSDKFYNKVDYTLACNQYNKYINYLIENDVKPVFIDITKSSKQVYAKDIAFIIKEEADNFATNLVYLGNNKLVTSNISVGNKLNKLGYNAEVIDYSEIGKGDGSVDCSTLALLRE